MAQSHLTVLLKAIDCCGDIQAAVGLPNYSGLLHCDCGRLGIVTVGPGTLPDQERPAGELSVWHI